MNPIKGYLKNETFLEDKKEAKKIKKLSFLYYLDNDWLYKRSSSMPLLLCLNKEKANYVLKELHEGLCESHVTGTSLALKALWNGYSWLTMKALTLDLEKMW